MEKERAEGCVGVESESFRLNIHDACLCDCKYSIFGWWADGDLFLVWMDGIVTGAFFPFLSLLKSCCF